jgi:hypothetical protein
LNTHPTKLLLPPLPLLLLLLLLLLLPLLLLPPPLLLPLPLPLRRRRRRRLLQLCTMRCQQLGEHALDLILPTLHFCFDLQHHTLFE